MRDYLFTGLLALVALIPNLAVAIWAGHHRRTEERHLAQLLGEQD